MAIKKKSRKFKHNIKKSKSSYDLALEKKRFSLNGLVAVILGLLSIIFILFLIYYSAMNGAQIGIRAGGAGMICAFVALLGGILAVGERNVEDMDLRLPRLGLWLCTLAFLIWLIILIIGIV
jgi:hypothetical protein